MAANKFYGNYQESGSCDQTGAENFFVSIGQAADTALHITGLWNINSTVTAVLTPNGLGFTIPPTAVSGTPAGTVTISGNGTRTASNPNIIANFNVIYDIGGGPVTDHCLNILWTKY